MIFYLVFGLSFVSVIVSFRGKRYWINEFDLAQFPPVKYRPRAAAADVPPPFPHPQSALFTCAFSTSTGPHFASSTAFLLTSIFLRSQFDSN